MANYQPPTENLPTFNPEVFSQNDEPLTIEEGTKYFLRYPNAQGTENLQTVNINGPLTVNSSTDLDTLFVSGTSSFENTISLTSTTASNRRVISSYYELSDINGNVNRTSEIYQNSQILTITNEATNGRTRFINSTAGDVPTTTFEIDTNAATMFEPLSLTSNLNVAGTLNANGAFNVPNNDAFIRGIRIGYGAGNLDRNTVVGANCGQNITTGNDNVMCGANSGLATSTGGSNVFLGSFAGRFNTTGGNNTYVGRDAGNTATTALRNTFVGREAGYRCIGNDNVCIGNESDCSGNISSSIAIGSLVKVLTSNTIILGLATQSVQIPGPVSLTSNNNLIFTSGTGTIQQPLVTGDMTTRNLFRLSDFAINGNSSTGTGTRFDFYDNFDGRGLSIMPNAGSGLFGATTRLNDAVILTRTFNSGAVTISNWNTNMRNGMRVFTTDISNCGLTLQCGQFTTTDWTEFRMAYTRTGGVNTTTTTFNNVINFNPPGGTDLPNPISSARRRLEGLGTLSFTDLSGGNSNGAYTSSIYTESTGVALPGLFYDTLIPNAYHQFSVRDPSNNIVTPIYYGQNITSVSNTFIVRSSVTPSNRFDTVTDSNQNTNMRARSTTASTNAIININCDEVNSIGTVFNRPVMTIAPTYIEVKRPIQFNYTTTPSASNQLGWFNSVNIIGSAYSTQTAPNSMGEIILASGTWKIEANFSFTASGNHTYSVFSYALSSANNTFPTALPYTIAYIQEPGLNINTNTATRQVNLTLQLSTTTSIFLLERVTFTGGGTTNISVNYGVTRIG